MSAAAAVTQLLPCNITVLSPSAFDIGLICRPYISRTPEGGRKLALRHVRHVRHVRHDSLVAIALIYQPYMSAFYIGLICGPYITALCVDLK